MATLLETERLVRKLTELLQQAGGNELAPKLAGDYAAACHTANLRLQQCEAMIKVGDRPQAVQLAETTPNLLGLITCLEFGGSDDWRGYCERHSLPVADRIDARSVRALNEAYARGITTDHPLYAAYRRAVLTRDDDEALRILQSITRLNPSDANAAAELTRLDAKVLAGKVLDLEGRTDEASLVAAIEAIEAFGFKGKPDGEVWRKAQTVRCAHLLKEAVRRKDSFQWAETLANIDFIHRLQQEFKVELGREELKRAAALEAWAEEEQAKDTRNREFQSTLAEQRRQIQESEEKDTSARYVELPELRADYEALNKTWRALTDFTRAIPEEAAAAFRKRSSLLEAEIARRTAIRRRMILAGSAAALALGAVVVWVVLGQIRTRDFAGRLQSAVAERQVRPTEQLLERLGAGEKRLLTSGSVNAAAATARTFVAKEHALLANFEAAFAKLPRELTGEPDPSRLSSVAEEFALARDSLNALAPDLKSENEPRLEDFEKKRRSFLSASGAAVNGLLDQWISSAEKVCGELDYRAPLEKTTAQLTTLAGLERKISDCESGFTNHLRLRGDLLQRAETLRAKFAAYAGELKKLAQGMTRLQNARTVQDFSDSIGVIASSEFSASPPARAASAVQSMNVSDESTLRALLGAANAGTWAYVNKPKAERFVPEVVMPAERQMLQQLESDPAVSADHQRYRLWLNREGTKTVEWITAGGIGAPAGWAKVMAWAPSSSDAPGTFANRDYGFFNGQYQLSPTEPVYRLEPLGRGDETAAFHSTGLEKVWSGGDTYAKALLEVLNSIKDSREGSPVFRAYLYLRLTEVMRLQPEAWGFAFCPALRSDEARLRKIVGDQLGDGDWFAPEKARGWTNAIEQFFLSVKPVSYARQADGLLALDRAAAKSGLRYAGFAGLDGHPKYIEGLNPGGVWGYHTAGQPPVLIESPMATNRMADVRGMPLSPLFALGRSSAEILAEAGVNPSDPSFRGALPPLFQQPDGP